MSLNGSAPAAKLLTTAMVNFFFSASTFHSAASFNPRYPGAVARLGVIFFVVIVFPIDMEFSFPV
jgi:hypothetical protein